MDVLVAAIELAHLRAEGLQPDEARRVSYVPTGPPRTTGSGYRVVGLQQAYLGVPIRTAVRSVLFAGDGRPTVTSRAVGVPGDTPTAPTVPVREAAYLACRAVAEGDEAVSNRRPRLRSQFPTPTRESVLKKVGFAGPVTAALRLVPTKAGLQLAWEVRVTHEKEDASFQVLVQARGRPEILGEPEPLTAHVVRGGVFFPGPPGADPAPFPFPPDAADYPDFGDGPLPDPSWGNGKTTVSNNASSADRGGDTVESELRDGDREFFPDGETERGVVNAFYLCNFLHDFFYRLGFTEEARNFQKVNHSGLGAGDDSVEVSVSDRKHDDRPAFFLSRLDGSRPELKLRKLGSRQTALDADVVLHEYVHGVTDRLVGDGTDERPFREKQSIALAEGFSDYFAVSIQNYYRRRDGVDPVWTFGAWTRGTSTGLRHQSYGPAFVGTYGSLGNEGFQVEHDAGQVWAQTLFELNAALATDGDPDTGDLRGWRVVFDSLVHLHPGTGGPHFLHARDAVLRELRRHAQGWEGVGAEAVEAAVWDVFTRRGMGPDASSPSAGFDGIVEDTGGGG